MNRFAHFTVLFLLLAWCFVPGRSPAFVEANSPPELRPAPKVPPRAPSQTTLHAQALPSVRSSAPYIQRRVPPLLSLAQLDEPDLPRFAVPLPEADLVSHRQGARVAPNPQGTLQNAGIVLIKFATAAHVAALRVPDNCEDSAIERLRQRADVRFAETDRLLSRQGAPSDPQFNQQWHHSLLESTNAWRFGLARSSIKVAIVDTPFLMNHPDLSANSVTGWDIVTGKPISSASDVTSPEAEHATATAGMAAAVVDNAFGIAGMGNFQILPINITGWLAEMYDAVIWAADHGVRVVNISWDGAHSSTLEEAGAYLEKKSAGMLVMSGVNDFRNSSYPAHPHIFAVSMTDAADNIRSLQGSHIDFAAPGFAVLTTSTNASFSSYSGTSFAAPVLSGLIAYLFSINPTLGPADVEAILKQSAVDKGPSGWDPYFGWGRVAFAAAAELAYESLPKARLISPQWFDGQFTVSVQHAPRFDYTLWKSGLNLPPSWTAVTNALFSLEWPDRLIVVDPAAELPQAFYRITLRPAPSAP